MGRLGNSIPFAMIRRHLAAAFLAGVLLVLNGFAAVSHAGAQTLQEVQSCLQVASSVLSEMPVRVTYRQVTRHYLPDARIVREVSDNSIEVQTVVSHGSTTHTVVKTVRNSGPGTIPFEETDTTMVLVLKGNLLAVCSEGGGRRDGARQEGSHGFGDVTRGANDAKAAPVFRKHVMVYDGKDTTIRSVVIDLVTSRVLDTISRIDTGKNTITPYIFKPADAYTILQQLIHPGLQTAEGGRIKLVDGGGYEATLSPDDGYMKRAVVSRTRHGLVEQSFTGTVKLGDLSLPTEMENKTSRPDDKPTMWYRRVIQYELLTPDEADRMLTAGKDTAGPVGLESSARQRE